MRKISKKDCWECRDNFYNGNNEYGIKECWCFSSAEMVQKFELGTDIPMNIRSAYKKKTVPSCFHKKGFVYLKGIPDYAK